MYTINDLYDLTHTLAGDYLARFTYPWEALSDLADYIRALGAQLDSEYLPFGPEVWVHRTAHIAPTASITAARIPPCSSANMPSMVVPPGEQTASLSAPGCSPVS